MSARVELLAQGVDVALLPVLDDVDQQRCWPSRRRIRGRRSEVREAVGDAAQEQRLAQAVHPLGEEPDVVVHVAGDRGEGRRRPGCRCRRGTWPACRLDAARPRPGRSRTAAVEPERVEPVGLAGHQPRRVDAAGRRDLAVDAFGQAHHLDARAAGSARSRPPPRPGVCIGTTPAGGQPVAVGPVGRRHVLVEAAAEPGPQLGVADAGHAQRLGRETARRSRCRTRPAARPAGGGARRWPGPGCCGPACPTTRSAAPGRRCDRRCRPRRG